jgi:DNA replication and repair protein RecF
MILKKLFLKNFRSYEECKIDFPEKKTLIVGKNAQGKTNLLEAVYYLATLSSFRAGSDSELIMWNRENALIKAEFIKYNSDIELEVILNPPNKKIMKVNGLKKTAYSQFLGNLLVVNFNVTDLLLLRGSPSDRRKWLDDAISQVYPAYRDRLNKYTKIKDQRNKFLKDNKGNFHFNSDQKEYLSVINEQLGISGSNIIHLRQKYLKDIQERANIKHRNISFRDEYLKIIYSSSVSGDFDTVENSVLAPDLILEKFLNVLKNKEMEEIARGQTVIGPHRDDLEFLINDKNAVIFASQGQQRTIVLALKLSEIDFIRNIAGESPLLLLDDVLAELDNDRQTFLLKSIEEDTQTIITTTNVSAFESKYLIDKSIYMIENGKLNLGVNHE